MPDNDDVILVCADANSPHAVPGTIFNKFCSTCGRQLMVAPSGQRILAQYPEAKVLCQRCFKPDKAGSIKPASDLEEMLKEASAAIPNWRRYRN